MALDDSEQHSAGPQIPWYYFIAKLATRIEGMDEDHSNFVASPTNMSKVRVVLLVVVADSVTDPGVNFLAVSGPPKSGLVGVSFS